MERFQISITIHGIEYCLPLRQRETWKYFRGYNPRPILKEEAQSLENIKISDEHFAETVRMIQEVSSRQSVDSCYAEYCAFSYPIFTALLKQNILALHGLSFVYRNGGIVLTAPSGTGKTTQFRNWYSTWKDEVTIINGDKTLIGSTDNQLRIFSSPWAGKENLQTSCEGILSHIICLEQGTENSIHQMSTLDKIEFLYPQIMYTASTEKNIRTVCNLLTLLIEKVQVVKFINDGTVQSTELLRRFLHDQLG